MINLIEDRILTRQNGELKRNIGLFQGNMGVCLALYLLAKKTGNVFANSQAEKILNNVQENIINLSNVHFDQGLAGIGWAINLLHEQNAIRGDIDDILYNIDAAVYKEVTKHDANIGLSVTDGVNGYLIYLLSRMKNPKHDCNGVQHRLMKSATMKCVDIICTKAPSLFSNLIKDLYISSIWNFPWVFFLFKQTMDRGIYTEKINAVIQSWSHYLRCSLPYYYINRLSLCVSLIYLNTTLHSREVEEHVDFLLSNIDFIGLQREVNEKIFNMNEGWFWTSYILTMALSHVPCTHPLYSELTNLKNEICKKNVRAFMSQLKSTNKWDNISFINGLSGVAVVKILHPDSF